MNYTAYNISTIQILEDALRVVARELVEIAPKILITVFLLALMIVLSMIIVKFVNKVLRMLKVDDLLKPLIERYQIPFSLTTAIVVLLILGLAMLTLYVITLSVFPQYLELVDNVIGIVSRLASVVFMILFVFISIFVVIERMRIERGLRGFMFLLAFLISLILIVDITSLSPELKHSLAWGLSLGIGLSIGVFTAWYFFGEALTGRRGEEGKQQS